MEFMSSIFIATGLAMDAFAVSLGIGTTRRAEDIRSRFRLSFHFGLFQGLMTYLGWLAGGTVASAISAFDHWIALALLGYVGGNMVRSGLCNQDKEVCSPDPSKGRMLIFLCVATSIDAMAVGFSMALVHTPITFPALLIGVVTLALSVFGLGVGKKLGQNFGQKMEIVGGLILIGIGLRIVFQHLLG